jgi:hypothetical protein
MATSIIFQVLDEEGERILDAFEEQTGLEPEEITDGREYPIDTPEQHEIKVVGTLTAIDEDWTDHLAIQDTSYPRGTDDD